MADPVIAHVPTKEAGQQWAHEASIPQGSTARSIISGNGSRIPASDSSGKARRKQHQRNPCFLIVICGLVLLVTVLIIWEQNLAMEKKHGSITPKPPMVDIYSPPIPFEGDDDDYDQKSLNYWGNHQDDRLKGLDLTGREDKKKMKKKKKNSVSRGKKNKKFGERNQKGSVFQAFPVINYDDDAIPQGVSGSVIHAADALLCRDTVIDYVINATDLRDECDGLKKAFTKTCTDDANDAEEIPIPSRWRRILDTEDGQSRQFEYPRKVQERNPLIDLQFRLQRCWHSFQHAWNHDGDTLFFAEEAVIEEWENARYEVENDFDLMPLNRLNDVEVKSMRDQQRRRIEQLQEKRVSGSNLSVPNKTKAVGNKEKLHLSLELPTTIQHVSNKMLSETLLLQNENKIIASAVKATQNQTGATNNAAYAAASSKAMSDTTDLVSSVLNDPTSVEARTCCASILNVFHENCSVADDEELSDKRLFIGVFVIALCGLVKSLIRHFHLRWLPEAAGCILVGACAGSILMYFPHHDISFDGKWFLRVMVPPIVFEAALSIDKRSFNRHAVPILIYSILGTLCATALTAVVVHEGSRYFHGLCETIPYIEALTFGALISSIDPIAVLSVLSNMGMTDTDTIYCLIFGESLLNDGVAIVLFQTLVHFLDENMEVDTHAVIAAIMHFLVVALGSLLIGVVSGACCTLYFWSMHGMQTALVEVLMFCCWALLPYYICDGIEWSGIVAVVATGFVMDLYVVGQYRHSDRVDKAEEEDQRSPQAVIPSRSRQQGRRQLRPTFSGEGHLSDASKVHIGFVTEILATTMETAIFAYLGLFLFSSRLHWNTYHSVIAIVGCCVSRAVMIPMLSFVANGITRVQQVGTSCHPQKQQLPIQDSGRKSGGPNNPAGVVIDCKMQLVLWFAGLRGAMSFALVEDIPLYDATTGAGTRLKSELKAMTSASIFFTVFVLGGCTFYMMDWLGMAPSLDAIQTQHTGVKEAELVRLLGKGSEDNEDSNDPFEENNDPTNIAQKKKVRQRFQH